MSSRRAHFYLMWNWEHDAGFLQQLGHSCSELGIEFHDISGKNLIEFATRHSAHVHDALFLDRASDSDPAFWPVVAAAEGAGARFVNPPQLARRAWDKAAMHELLVQAGIATPYTAILPPWSQDRRLLQIDEQRLGSPFIVKPASRGGGEGVWLGATSAFQIQLARQEYPDDRYLLQALVRPAHVNGQPSWFRVVFCDGLVFPCWWHPTTHIYHRVDASRCCPQCIMLWGIAHKIAASSGLALFSTEIALTVDSQWVVVDYVNDPLDLRLQSVHSQGVPDRVVRAITAHLARWALLQRP